MRNPHFDQLLREMEEIHDRKNQDYAEEGNPYSNFEFAARFAGVDVDTVFRVLIGTKEARIRELLKGKDPHNESLQDSYLDQSVYTTLRASYNRLLTELKVFDPARIRPLYEHRVFDPEVEDALAQTYDDPDVWHVPSKPEGERVYVEGDNE